MERFSGAVTAPPRGGGQTLSACLVCWTGRFQPIIRYEIFLVLNKASAIQSYQACYYIHIDSPDKLIFTEYWLKGDLFHSIFHPTWRCPVDTMPLVRMDTGKFLECTRIQSTPVWCARSRTDLCIHILLVSSLFFLGCKAMCTVYLGLFFQVGRYCNMVKGALIQPLR